MAVERWNIGGGGVATGAGGCWLCCIVREPGHVGGRIDDEGEEKSQEGGLMLGGWQAELHGQKWQVHRLHRAGQRFRARCPEGRNRQRSMPQQ